MHVACCQLDIAWEHKPANYRRVEALLPAAEIPSGTLVLLPEMFATGFTMNAEAAAEPIDGPTPRFLAELAQAARDVRRGGRRPPHGRRERPRNEALLFGPDGQLLARYAKIHLFTFAGEQEHYAAGTEMEPFQLDETAIAPCICYDLRFPELFRTAVAQRFRGLSVIACWPAAREEHWRALLMARAIENQCYVVGGQPLRQRSVGDGLFGRQPDHRSPRRDPGRWRSDKMRDPSDAQLGVPQELSPRVSRPVRSPAVERPARPHRTYN